MRARCLPAGLVLLAAALPAQLDLTVTGGSLGRTLDTRLGPYNPLILSLIVLSVTPGPTPLGILDPRDPRQLRVGVESLGISFAGFTGTDGYFAGPTLAVPNWPWLADRALFFQGLTLDGLAGVNWLVGPVSAPRAVWFAPQYAFRNRFTQLAQPRAFFGEALPLPDGLWMAAAGGAGALLAQVALDTTEIHDPMTDSFFAGPRLVRPRSLHTTTRLNDGTWLFAAGVDANNDPQDNSEILDPVLLSFRAVAGPMTARRMGHSATKLPNGRVLVAGGLSDLNGTGIDPINSALASTEIYNPATDTWSPGPSMARPRAGHAAIVLPNGRILLAGGVGYTTVFGIRFPQIWRETELYDPSTGTISGGPTMATARAIYSVADLGGGRYLLAGGVSSLLGLGAPTAAAGVYDPGSNAFTPAGSMAAARGMSAVFSLGGGRFLHIGGADGTLLNPNALASTEVYDIATNAFTPGPPLTMSRAASGTFTSPTGQFHLIGGGTGMNAATTPTTEWFYR